MKLSLAGIQLGLVWFFGFLAGIGFIVTVSAILNDLSISSLILPVVLFFAGLVFGGLISRMVMARIAKLTKK